MLTSVKLEIKDTTGQLFESTKNNLRKMKQEFKKMKNNFTKPKRILKNKLKI